MADHESISLREVKLSIALTLEDLSFGVGRLGASKCDFGSDTTERFYKIPLTRGVLHASRKLSRLQPWCHQPDQVPELHAECGTPVIHEGWRAFEQACAAIYAGDAWAPPFVAIQAICQDTASFCA